MRRIRCAGGAPPKYDIVTRWLHAALALAVLVDLALASVMRVPPGPGLGVFDWHRQAFELHCRFGPVVAVLCVLHWLWLCLPFARPGIGYLFPWRSRDLRAVLGIEIGNLARLEVPAAHERSPLAGSVQGFGLCAVTAATIAGATSYLGYFTRVAIPAAVLHWCALELIITSYLVWAFVIAHGSMAVVHALAGYRHRAAAAAE